MIPRSKQLLDGTTPAEAIDALEALEGKVRDLRNVVSHLCRAYDAELHRIYGYDFTRPLPPGVSSEIALALTRAMWAEEIAGLEQLLPRRPTSADQRFAR